MINLSRHKIISAGWAIAFVVVVQWFASPQPIFRFLIPAIIIFTFLLSIYNWYYLKSQPQLNTWFLIRVPILILTWFGVLFILPTNFFRNIFLILSLPVIFFFETLVANKGQQLSSNLFLLSLATLFLSIFGLHFYFPLTGVVYLIIIFLTVLILVRISVESVPHSNSVKWLSGLVLALFACELFWVLQFLPLHFSVLAIISFNVLYLLWTIYYHYLYQTLTDKQIQFNVALAFGLSLFIIISSPWSILN